MQKATYAITVPYTASHLYLRSMQSLHSLQGHNHKSSIKSRFCVHETLQKNQSNFLIFRNTFVQSL